MARSAEPAELVQARESFFNGAAGEIAKGDIFRSDDPLVRAIPHMFVPLVLRSTAKEPRVEQATAAPGEKRGA